MSKNIYIIFVAGGSGTRMRTRTPKQFLELARKPILLHTVQRFVDALPEAKVLVVLPKIHFKTWKDICRQANFEHPQILVEGGITRFHSVKNALSYIRDDDGIVLVHDGVRPMVSESLIREIASRAMDGESVVPVVPVTDTLKSLVKSTVDGEYVESGAPAPNRNLLFGAQTPQAFPTGVLKKAYQRGFSPDYTDDASVVSDDKTPLIYILGERYNIKVTTPEDLEFLEKVYQGL